MNITRDGKVERGSIGDVSRRFCRLWVEYVIYRMHQLFFYVFAVSLRRLHSFNFPLHECVLEINRRFPHHCRRRREENTRHESRPLCSGWIDTSVLRFKF